MSSLRWIRSDVTELLYKSLFVNSQATVAETTNYIACLFWGLTLVLPVDTFNSSPAFDLLSSIPHGETVLGWTSLSLGAIPLLGFVAFREIKPATRTVIPFISFLFWLSVAVNFFIASPTSTAFGIYFTLSINAALIYLRQQLINYKTVIDEIEAG